jgi:hypothetical protein
VAVQLDREYIREKPSKAGRPRPQGQGHPDLGDREEAEHQDRRERRQTPSVASSTSPWQKMTHGGAGSSSPETRAPGDRRFACCTRAVHVTFAIWMKSIISGGIVLFVEDVVFAGDVNAGDVVVLPGASSAVLVKTVRLGQGGFIFTVAPIDDDRPQAEQLVTLTASACLRKHGSDLAN